MNPSKHCYLFALEVEPLLVGVGITQLPLHCTIMHRFLSDLEPSDLMKEVQSVFRNIKPILLKSGREEMFGKPVNVIEQSAELIKLHKSLHDMLIDLPVEFTAPQWVGNGYTPHVSHQGNISLPTGTEHTVNAVYLIEVKVPNASGLKFARAKFSFIQ